MPAERNEKAGVGDLSQIEEALKKLVPNNLIRTLLYEIEKGLRNTSIAFKLLHTDISERKQSLPKQIIVNELSTAQLNSLIHLQEAQQQELDWQKYYHTIGKRTCGALMDEILDQTPLFVRYLNQAIKVAEDPKPYQQQIRERAELCQRLEGLRELVIKQARQTFMY